MVQLIHGLNVHPSMKLSGMWYTNHSLFRIECHSYTSRTALRAKKLKLIKEMEHVKMMKI